MTELGPYAVGLAAAASAWGAFVPLTWLWDRPEFRASHRRAGVASAALLVVAFSGLAWAAWTGDVRYSFVAPFSLAPGSWGLRLASLLSPAPRLLLLVTLLAVAGAWACRRPGPSSVRRRFGALWNAVVLAGVLTAALGTEPWRSGGGLAAPPPPEALEPLAIAAGYLRVSAVAGFGVVFLLLWSSVSEVRQEGALLRTPYRWGAWAWLCLTGAVLADYAALAARATALEALAWVGAAAAPAWLLAIGFLHAAGLGRRRPRGGVVPLSIGVALFPLSFPLLAEPQAYLAWWLGGGAAVALGLAAAVRAEAVRLPGPSARAFSRDSVVVGAALLLSAGAALALGARFSRGSLPEWLWVGLAAGAALAGALALVFPAIDGRLQQIAVRLAPFLLLGFAAAAAASFASGDLWFGIGCALIALNLVLAGREILSARPGQRGLWLVGASCAHTGLALIFTALAAARLGAETTAAVRPGGLVVAETGLVGSVEVRYLGLSLYRAPGANKWAASVEIEGLGKPKALHRAEQWVLPGRSELYHVPTTVRSLSGSLDVDLSEVISGADEHVRLHVRVRPLAGALWLGALLLAAGAVCGLASTAARGRRPR